LGIRLFTFVHSEVLALRMMRSVENPPRRTVRFPFVAHAQVVPEDGTTVRTKVKELSLHGCYLEFGGPLPTGSHVTLRIVDGQEFFEAGATVVYCQTSAGIGLVFRNVKPHYLSILQGWLLRAMKEPDPER
jgi:PilZ domain